MSKKEENAEQKVRFLDRFDRNYLVLTAILLVHIIGFHALGVANVGRVAIGGVDPVGYYAYLPSLFFDGDLDFENEYRNLRGFGWASPDQERTRTGKLPNPYSVGVALFWFPMFLVAHLICELSGIPANGYSAPYHTMIYLGNVLYGFLGMLLSYRLASRIFDKTNALLATALVWLASGTLYYLLPIVPVSHTVSMFSVTVFLLYWYQKRDRETYAKWGVLGLLGGLAALVRWQNALFMLLPGVPELFRLAKRQPLEDSKKHLLNLVCMSVVFVVSFFPQMAAWKVLFGSFVTVPQGGSFVNWFKPDLLDVLFSTRHGLITWTPVAAFAIAGLACFPKKDRRLALYLSLTLVLQIYVNAIAGWVGWSFSMRRFINCTPILVIGLAALIERVRPRLKLAIPLVAGAALVLWNFLFVLQYYAGMIPRDDYLTYDQLVTQKFLVLISLFG